MDPTRKRRAFANVIILLIGLGLFSFLIKQAWSSRKFSTPMQNLSPSDKIEGQTEAKIINAAEVNKILKTRQQNVTILDIQERPKFKEGHIPSSINIPSDELEVRAQDELSRSNLIIIVDCACDGTNTASLMRHSVLVSMGFSNVAVMDEGLNAWKRASFELVVEQ
jgi:phage shock protein E